MQQKSVLVTGASKGIGEACALYFCRSGFLTFAGVRKAEDGERLKGLAGENLVPVQLDVTSSEDIEQVAFLIHERVGEQGLSALVNNAGVIRRSPAKDYLESDWDATLEIDLTAAFLLSQAAGRIMLEKKKGKIINVASIISFQGGLNVSAYAAAKHGIAGLTKALANDWAKHGVNVNAIAPGFFETELTEALQNDPVRSESIKGRTPAGRWGLTEDLAGAAVFLAAPASDFVNGVVLPVDGGWMAW